MPWGLHLKSLYQKVSTRLCTAKFLPHTSWKIPLCLTIGMHVLKQNGLMKKAPGLFSFAPTGRLRQVDIYLLDSTLLYL